MRYFTIGQLAKASQVGIETLRFYERRGLLPSPPRSASGYRHFSEDTIHRLHFIRRAKELGFSLKEVAELLALHDQEHSDRAQVKTITAAKLAEIERKIHDLQRIRAMLSQLLTECSGEGPLNGCPIIEALTGDEVQVSSSAKEVNHERPATASSLSSSDHQR